MRFNYLKARLKTAALVASVLLLGARTTIAQQTINLTAGPATTTLPDGKTVPMWGYSCTSVTGTAAASGAQTCAALNTAGTGSWSPILITVPSGQNLNISLTNNLTFGANSIPTSITIVGQVGGGLGTSATTAPSPDHTNAQSNVTWPIANNGGGTGTPPVQPDRVQSFSTEVIPGGTATTGQCPSPCSLTWTTPKPGTYLIESGTHPSIQGPMGLYGVLVVTTAPAGATPGTAYPAVGTRTAATYNAEVTALFSEIDPVQNAAVNTAVGTAGFKETNVWSGQPGMCGNPGAPVAVLNTCYPPAVNYTPLYYLINGVAFNKTSASASLFPVISGTATPPVTGTALVRLVNAGSRMHVPSIVGSQTGTGPTPPTGFSLVAEDGNPLPGAPRVQSEVFMAAGKTYDVAINIPAACVPVGTATTCVNSSLPIYDRELSLSSNAIGHDSGMLAYIGVNGSTVPVAPAIAAATANPDAYSVAPGQTLTVSDPSKGVMGNDINVYGVALLAPVTGLTFYPDGTFTYTGAGATFTYCGNGTTSGQACAQVTITPSTAEAGSGISMGNLTYTAKTATYLKIAPSGVLQADKDALGYSLTVDTATVAASSGLTLSVDPNGGFVATVGGAGTYSFTYKAKNSQGTDSASTATVTLVFPTASGLAVSVVDGATKAAITDYRWIIEEDRTFWVDPANTTNNGGTSIVPTFGTNFHTSYMPVIATGCTGTLSCESGQSLLGKNAVCDIGNGVCRTTATQETPLDPSQVALDPARRYYISVLPGDAANPFNAANLSSTCATVNGVSTCGHGMGGAPIAAACKPVAPATTCTGTFNAVTVLAQPTPFPSAKLSVYVFEDDFPLNGEQDAGGGIDILAPNEPGLGGFNITLFDDAGGTGDATGQMTYDMFNQPLSNSLAGTKDPATGLDACPISANPRQGANDPTQTGITGTIVTCPKYEAGGTILSPLAGQAVVANMMPGRYGVVATPAADRIARGEEWLQTNTLDGQKAHDSFLKIGEAGYFQEYGPAGYHVSIGFANPAIINSRLAGVCKGTDPNVTGNNCTNSVTGVVTTERMSRTPDERLYSSGDNSSFAFTQCYVSLGDPDGEDFAFTKCDSNGNFKLSGLPDGVWRITVFDQWNDMLVDGLSTPVSLSKGATTDMGQIAMNQWQANIYTTTFFDTNRNGVRDSTEQGLTLLPTNIRFLRLFLLL